VPISHPHSYSDIIQIYQVNEKLTIFYYPPYQHQQMHCSVYCMVYYEFDPPALVSDDRLCNPFHSAWNKQHESNSLLLVLDTIFMCALFFDYVQHEGTIIAWHIQPIHFLTIMSQSITHSYTEIHTVDYTILSSSLPLWHGYSLPYKNMYFIW
jgi:hypothetical protein